MSQNTEIPPVEPDLLVRRPVFQPELPEREALTSLAQAKRLLEARDELSPRHRFFHIDELRDAVANCSRRHSKPSK